MPPRLAPAGSAERTLRALLVLSFVFPIFLFSVASWISYHEHFTDARDRLDRNLNRITEHAAKVFETFELSELYVDELLSNVSADDIRKNESAYHAKLQTIVANLPQLRDLWVVGSDGFTVVAGSVFPMPHLDVSDRDYFRRQKNDAVNGAYISTVLRGRISSTRSFIVSHKREIQGQFAGVTVVSI